MKKVLRFGYYLLAKAFALLVLLMPYRCAVWFGGFLGGVAYHVIGDARRVAHTNLRLCFPEKSDVEIARIAREVFVNQGKNLFEVFSFPKLSAADIRALVPLETREVMESGIRRGNGVLIASAHCGNWELMGASLAAHGFPINVIARKIYIEGLNQMLVRFRQSKQVNVILRSGTSAAKDILRSLRHNEAIGILIDQDTRVPGVFVDFFARPAFTPSGLATLALKTDAAVILALDVRCNGISHKAVLRGPFELIRTGNMEKDVFENTQMITAQMEAHIRQYPGQWVWMHERWKTDRHETDS